MVFRVWTTGSHVRRIHARLHASSNLGTDFNNPQGALLGILNAILPLGAVFGAFPAAYISDRWGRRWAMTVGDIIMIVGAALQTGSINSKPADL